MPWEKSDDNVSPVGALSVYAVNRENDDWKFSQTWTVSYTVQTNILHWCEESCTLFVGLDNGEIHMYRVPAEHKGRKFEKVSIFRLIITQTTVRIIKTAQ